MQPMKINYDLLRQKASRFRSAAENLRQMRGAIGLEIGCLDWEIKCRYNMEGLMTDAAKASERLAAMSDELALLLERTVELVQSAEQSPGDERIKIGPYKPPIKLIPKIPPFIGFSPIIAPIVGGIKWIGEILKPANPSPDVGSGTNGDYVVIPQYDFLKKRDLLKEYMNSEHYGKKYEGEFSGQHCKGFVRQIYKDIFGLTGLPRTQGNNYEYAAYDKLTQVGQIVTENTITKPDDLTALGTEVEQLFGSAKVGDIVQMAWDTGSGPHSAIFMGIENGRIQFFDANMDAYYNAAGELVNQDGIQTHSYSFEEYANKIKHASNGVTIYTPTQMYTSTPVF